MLNWRLCEAPAPGFRLAQLWPLQPLAGVKQGTEVSVALSNEQGETENRTSELLGEQVIFFLKP